jgi:hypothetical protein
VRIRMAEGLAADVELVTVGGDAPRPTNEPAPPPTTEPPDTVPTETTPPTTGPPVSAPPTGPPTVPPNEPPNGPPSGPPPAQASMWTWTGVLLIGVSMAAWLLVSRRKGRRLRRRGIFLSLVVVGAIAAAGCYGGRPASPPAWPGIYTRAYWGGPNGPPCAGYTSRLRFSVVHHTGGGPQDNDYTNPAAKINGIYAYHLSAGYCDIAYNFLVDKYGGMWEGRAGGMGSPVLGAHTLNFNSESTGVAILGDFTSVNASAAAQGALETLLAWKFSIPGNTIDPYSPVSKNGYWISPISAHRELYQTGCPGNSFYPDINRIRGNVAGRVFYGSPVGNLETVSRSSGVARAIGWALDPDVVDPVGIHIYVDSTGYAPGIASIYRPDIANLYPAWGGNHGFDFSVPISGGPRNVCVYALSVVYGGPTLLGCRTV